MALHVMDEVNRCLQCKNPQCVKGCPIQTPIPEVIRLLKENRLDEAGRILFENNPLTTVCSLICNHENQCEGHCVLGKKGRKLRQVSMNSPTPSLTAYNLNITRDRLRSLTRE